MPGAADAADSCAQSTQRKEGIFHELRANCFNSSWKRVPWALEGGEHLKARYEALATRAGIKLGAPDGIRPFDYWLDAVSAAEGMWNLCEASAIFCSHLERKALETSRSTTAVELKESAVGGNWFESDTDVLRRRQIVLRNPRMPSKNLSKVFDGTAPPIPLPRDWQTELGLHTWSEAYGSPTGRNRIQKIISTDRRTGKTGSS
jgi:hypothetical protein